MVREEFRSRCAVVSGRLYLIGVLGMMKRSLLGTWSSGGPLDAFDGTDAWGGGF